MNETEINESLKGFTHRLKHLIKKELGLTLNEFSKRTGFSSGALSKILNGNTSTTVNRLYQIKAGYGHLNFDWLLFADGPIFLEGDESIYVVLDQQKQELAELRQALHKAEAKIEALENVIRILITKGSEKS